MEQKLEDALGELIPAVARVSRLWRYPVKSMLGDACGHLDLNHRGAEGDRLFAVREPDGKLGSGKTTRRFRKIDGLLAFSAAYHRDAPRISFPDGRCIDGDDPAIHLALSDALHRPVTLARESAVSHLDAGPIHLLTTASLAWLSSLRPDSKLDARRFRPNILVEVPGNDPIERRWLGKTIRIGAEVQLRVTTPTERCIMVGHAQADLPEDAQVLRDLVCNGNACFGAYAEVLIPGRIECGDLLAIRP